MSTFKEYHDFYMTSDVLLVSDCFEAFRQSVLEAHGLDCLYFPTLPSMTFQMALKMTDVELDLITDADQFFMIESGIRGGLSYVSHRYAEANHPSLPYYLPEEPISDLCYWDANSLYATCMTYSLPVGDFRFLSQAEIDSFDVNSISDDVPIGYVLEVDLVYPQHLHSVHAAYPLCPEHWMVEADMLSPTLEQMYDHVGATHIPSTKLITNLNDKHYCVTHYKCLKFYLSQGMQLAKIHRILSYSCTDCLSFVYVYMTFVRLFCLTICRFVATLSRFLWTLLRDFSSRSINMTVVFLVTLVLTMCWCMCAINVTI